MNSVVEVGAIECECCTGYNIIERIIGADSEPVIVAGPYPTRKSALIAGKKYVSEIMGE